MRWKLVEQLVWSALLRQIVQGLNTFLTLQVLKCNILEYFCPHIALKRRVNTMHIIHDIKH